jgi:arylsulfatase A-like enzyme
LERKRAEYQAAGKKLSWANERRAVRGPAYEAADVADDAYGDGQLCNMALASLRRMADREPPFFLAVGFIRPHLPFVAPQRYWDLYDPTQIELADNPSKPSGAPDLAMHSWGELRTYHDIPLSGPLDEGLARTLVHGYYACVSYTDALVGRLLAACWMSWIA